MALKTTKSTTVIGRSIIGGKEVVNLLANITTEAGNTSITQNILDQELYDANKTECRKDVSAFQQIVWEVEDELIQEVEVQK